MGKQVKKLLPAETLSNSSVKLDVKRRGERIAHGREGVIPAVGRYTVVTQSVTDTSYTVVTGGVTYCHAVRDLHELLREESE